VRQQVNLYQPIFRKQAKKFSARAMLQAVAIVMLGIVLLFAWTQWQVSLLREESARADQQLAASSKRLEEVVRQFGGQVRGISIDEEISRLEQQIASKQHLRSTLGAGIFSNTRGFSEYFAAFARQGQPGLWLTSFDIVGAAEQMTLQGRTTSDAALPRYIQRLSTESRLAGIEFRVFSLEREKAEQGKAPPPYLSFTLKTAIPREGVR
jgi:hypothetical protein